MGDSSEWGRAFSQRLANGSVEIEDFGAFIVRQYSAYTGRHPRTGESIQVPEKRLPFFKPARRLKDALSEAAGGRLSYTLPAHVPSIWHSVVEELCTSGYARLGDLGLFRMRRTQGRTGRNPQTGALIPIPPRTALVFHPSGTFKELLSDGPSSQPRTPLISIENVVESHESYSFADKSAHVFVEELCAADVAVEATVALGDVSLPRELEVLLSAASGDLLAEFEPPFLVSDEVRGKAQAHLDHVLVELGEKLGAKVFAGFADPSYEGEQLAAFTPASDGSCGVLILGDDGSCGVVGSLSDFLCSQLFLIDLRRRFGDSRFEPAAFDAARDYLVKCGSGLPLERL